MQWREKITKETCEAFFLISWKTSAVSNRLNGWTQLCKLRGTSDASFVQKKWKSTADLRFSSESLRIFHFLALLIVDHGVAQVQLTERVSFFSLSPHFIKIWKTSAVIFMFVAANHPQPTSSPCSFSFSANGVSSPTGREKIPKNPSSWYLVYSSYYFLNAMYWIRVVTTVPGIMYQVSYI